MSTARERVQQEADARWPLTPNVWEDQHNRDRRGAFIAGRTVSAEQLESMAASVWVTPGSPRSSQGVTWGEELESVRWACFAIACNHLRTAGFIVEEEAS